MPNKDLILDASSAPSFNDITSFFPESVQRLWLDLNQFIQTQYQTQPKIEFSKCTLQMGWNIKYKKGGKSLCTLYPAHDYFIALIVVKTEMIPVIESLSTPFESHILDLVKSARPMNGTLWLMIEVKSQVILDNVKELLLLKQAPKV